MKLLCNKFFLLKNKWLHVKILVFNIMFEENFQNKLLLQKINLKMRSLKQDYKSLHLITDIETINEMSNGPITHILRCRLSRKVHSFGKTNEIHKILTNEELVCSCNKLLYIVIDQRWMGIHFNMKRKKMILKKNTLITLNRLNPQFADYEGNKKYKIS